MNTEDLGENTVDLGIALNFGVSLSIGTLMLVFFVVCRKYGKWIYWPNLRVFQTHPVLHEHHMFSWIRHLYRVSDYQMLLLVGFDAFVLLAMLRFWFYVFFWLSIVVCIVLIPLYMAGADSTSQIYTNSSIVHLQEGSVLLWAPFFMTWIVSLALLYALFVFYTFYSELQKAYTISPSTLTSICQLYELKQASSDLDTVCGVIDMCSRTVLINEIDRSTIYNEESLRDYISMFGVGEVESVLVLGKGLCSTKLVQRRRLVDKLEEECMKLLNRAEAAIRSSEARTRCQFLNLADWEDMDRHFGCEEQRELLEFSSLSIFLTEFRTTVVRQGKKVDSIGYYYQQLLMMDLQISEVISRDLCQAESSVKCMGHKMQDFQLATGTTSLTALVTFKEKISSEIVQQCIADPNPHSFQIYRAPYFNDVLWTHLGVSYGVRLLRFCMAYGIFMFINLIWALLVSIVTFMSRLSIIVSTFPSLKFINHTPRYLQALVEAVLSPLLLSLLLVLIREIFWYISLKQGHASKSLAQKSMLKKYLIFLYLQGFVVTLLSGSLLDTLYAVVQTADFSQMVDRIKESFSARSSFYFNLVVLKVALDLCFDLADPGLFFVWMIIHWIRRGYATETPKRRYKAQKSRSIRFGALYPTLSYVFGLVIAYSCISPVILVGGCIYYGTAYVVYKYQFLYRFRNYSESGGIYWNCIFNYIVISLVSFQSLMMVQFVVQKGHIQAYLLVPLLILTLMYRSQLVSMFEKKSSHLPLNLGHMANQWQNMSGFETKIFEFLNKLYALQKTLVKRGDAIDSRQALWIEKLDPPVTVLQPDKNPYIYLANCEYYQTGPDCVSLPNRFYALVSQFKTRMASGPHSPFELDH